MSAIVFLTLAMPPAAVADPASREAALLETVLRGVEARENVVRAKLGAFAGSWRVEMANREPPKRPPGQPTDLAARASAPLKRVIWFVDTLVAGEKYRETFRLGSPPRVQVKGYDGTDAWAYEHDPSAKTKPASHPTGMTPVSSLLGAELCGLAYIIDPDSKSRLSQWVRRGQPKLLGEETIAGHKCFRLQFLVSAGSRVTDEIWLCPGYGYAMLRWQHGTRNTVWRYSDFQQFDGIWLPRSYSITHESEIPGKGWVLMASKQSRLLALRVDSPVSPGSFKPPQKDAPK